MGGSGFSSEAALGELAPLCGAPAEPAEPGASGALVAPRFGARGAARGGGSLVSKAGGTCEVNPWHGLVVANDSQTVWQGG